MRVRCIARYLLRAPVSLERLWHNPEAGTVTIRPLAGEGDTPGIPLLCPECGHGMQIISFITDPPVVDKILRHLKCRPEEAFLPAGTCVQRLWSGDIS